MFLLCRRLVWMVAAVLVMATLPGRAAVGTEKGAFDAAAKAFQDKFYARAESEFAEFVKQFTNSARIPEALLFQAEARLQQNNYPGAIELLSTQLAQAGRWADEYVFWLAEAYLRNGDFAKAGEQFASLVRQFPSSPRRLEAAISETTARSRLGEWSRVIELLQQTNGVFQIAARANSTNDLALRGYLLLSEAHLAQQDNAAAEAALEPIGNLPLAPRLAWQRQYLLSRIQIAQGKQEPALAAVTNLLTLATNTTEKALLADSIALQAWLLERLGRLDEAMSAYERNLAEGFPAERQQQAVAKIAELGLERNRVGNAMRVLDRFCAENRQSPARERALLTLGELRLRQHISAPGGAQAAPRGTNAAPATNDLQLALAALDTFSKDYPQSALLGRAQLTLGWCYWLQTNLPQAQAAFQLAAERLPDSLDQGTALFKVGDARFRQNDFEGAITNYQRLLERYAAHPEVRSNLFEPALYQVVRAGLAGTNFAAATNALQQILSSYPSSFHTEHAVLIAGQAIARRGERGDPERARAIYLDFVGKAPEALLLPEVRLAIARTYEQEGKWDFVIDEYDSWLKRFTNSPSTRPRVEYLRAWANFQAGRETNAFQLFTNFVARFSSDECTPLARWWVADYYFRTGKFREAEENYQLIYLSTNWLQATNLSYQARLMAGRTAIARQGWTDAVRYITSLTSDAKCPADIWVQATFAYANIWMLQDSTNKLADYAEAIKTLNNILERFPTNQMAVLALGEKASCLLQWAQTAPQYEAAASEFQKLITNGLADAKARGIARVGLGIVLEKQAQQKTGTEQSATLNRALQSYLDVFYYDKDLREDERPDPFWVRKAGWEAGRLSEALQNWAEAIKVYERLHGLFPALRPAVEKKLIKAYENLARSRS